MDRGALQALVDQGQLTQCPADAQEASSRLAQSRVNLETARTILLGAALTNPRGASSLAWEAVLGILLGWLSMFGYRITSERGHHSVAIRAVGAILDSREAIAQLRRLDGLRRLRDNALYNNLPVHADEVQAFLPDIAALGNSLERAIQHLGVRPAQPPPTSRS